MADYDTIELDADEKRTERLGSGDTLENILYDVRAEGAGVSIIADGTSWEVRNVGVRGTNNAQGGVFGVGDTGGGTSTIENVYLGDGLVDAHRAGPAVWVNPNHTGTLEIQRVYCAESNDNAFYGSAPKDKGIVNYRNCYSRDSWVAHFRLAKGVVENCVAVNTNKRMDGRGIWAWSPGPITVRDCDLAVAGKHYSIVAGANEDATVVNVHGTSYDTGYHGGTREAHGSSINLRTNNDRSPSDRTPAGCPTTAAMAASGNETDNSGDDNSNADAPMPDLEHTITLEGQMNYRIEATGEVAPSENIASWVTEGEAYANDETGNWIEWFLTGSSTEWQFDGDIVGVSLDQYDGTKSVDRITIDGTEVAEADIADGWAGHDEDDSGNGDTPENGDHGQMELVVDGTTAETYEIVWADETAETDTYVRISPRDGVDFDDDLAAAVEQNTRDLDQIDDELDVLIGQVDAIATDTDENTSRLGSMRDSVVSLAEKLR